MQVRHENAYSCPEAFFSVAVFTVNQKTNVVVVVVAAAAAWVVQLC